MPSLFSFLGTVMLLFCNILSFFGIIGFFIPIFESLSKLYVLILLGGLAIFNYLVLYRGDYYKEVFWNFDRESRQFKGWDKSVKIYIISSIALLLIVLVIANYRNNGHL